MKLIYTGYKEYNVDKSTVSNIFGEMLDPADFENLMAIREGERFLVKTTGDDYRIMLHNGLYMVRVMKKEATQ